MLRTNITQVGDSRTCCAHVKNVAHVDCSVNDVIKCLATAIGLQ